MKKIIVLAGSVILSVGQIFAGDTVTVDKIKYELTGNNTCKVVRNAPDYSTLNPGYNGDIIIPDSITYNNNVYYVTEIGSKAFEGLNVTSVSIPASVTRIGSRAFAKCTDLNSVNIPTAVTEIEDYTFQFCNNITSLELPQALTAIKTEAFYGIGCASVSLPESLIEIGERAFEASFLKQVLIPESVDSIGVGAFACCDSLTAIDVATDHPKFSSVEGVLFSKDGSELIQYPAGKTETTYSFPDGIAKIGEYAFGYCKNLVAIHIPNSVTSIGREAFYYCSRMSHLTIPPTVNEIGESAFTGCWMLQSLTYLAEEPLDNCPNIIYGASIFDNATLNYLASAKKKIEKTAPWNGFVHRIGREADFVASINEVVAPRADSGAVYDLQGRRVANPGKGLYIVNGQKTLIR